MDGQRLSPLQYWEHVRNLLHVAVKSMRIEAFSMPEPHQIAFDSYPALTSTPSLASARMSTVQIVTVQRRTVMFPIGFQAPSHAYTYNEAQKWVNDTIRQAYRQHNAVEPFIDDDNRRYICRNALLSVLGRFFLKDDMRCGPNLFSVYYQKDNTLLTVEANHLLNTEKFDFRVPVIHNAEKLVMEANSFAVFTYKRYGLKPVR